MEGRRDAKEYYLEYLQGMASRPYVVLANRCLRLIDSLHEKGAVVEVNDNERFTLYVELPKDEDKWIPIMVKITNTHPQKIFHLVEGSATVIKVAMVDGIREA